MYPRLAFSAVCVSYTCLVTVDGALVESGATRLPSEIGCLQFVTVLFSRYAPSMWFWWMWTRMGTRKNMPITHLGQQLDCGIPHCVCWSSLLFRCFRVLICCQWHVLAGGCCCRSPTGQPSTFIGDCAYGKGRCLQCGVVWLWMFFVRLCVCFVGLVMEVWFTTFLTLQTANWVLVCSTSSPDEPHACTGHMQRLMLGSLPVSLAAFTSKGTVFW